VALHSNVPDRFQPGLRLLALTGAGSRRELHVQGLWPHKGNLVLKFAGLDSISDAEELAGCELQVPREERAKLDAEWNYVSDLLGCAVFDAESELGRVQNVQFGAGEAPLLVVAGAARTYEIPYAQAFLKSVDLGRKRIEMQLPEGLLEVNAPLSSEEKAQQKAAGRPRQK
jgi:16S rRNA processing protein RimM